MSFAPGGQSSVDCRGCLASWTVVGNRAAIEHERFIRELENSIHLLFDDQECGPGRMNSLQAFIDSVNCDWRETQRKLIGYQQFGRDDENAGERQESFLASRKVAAALVTFFLQNRESVVRSRKGVADTLATRSLPEDKCQILFDRQAGEDAATLWNMGDAKARNAVCRPVRGISPVNSDGSLGGANKTCNHSGYCRFSGAVGAEQRLNRTLAYLEADVEKRTIVTIGGINVG